MYRAVDREGRVSLPEVGPVLVSGKSLADVQQNLQQTLRTTVQACIRGRVARAAAHDSRVRGGRLANPGAYDMSSLSTPLNALFEAGGPTPRGSLRIVKHYRGDQMVEEVDLYDLLLHGVKTGMETAGERRHGAGAADWAAGDGGRDGAASGDLRIEG